MKKIKNPSPAMIALGLGTVLVAGGVGYFLWTKDDKKSKAKPPKITPPPRCEAQPGIPNYRLSVINGQDCGTCEHVSTIPNGTATLSHCDLYDKNVSTTCVCDTWTAMPTETDNDEYGLKFNADCSDFTMVEPVGATEVDPEDHWQAKILKEVIDNAVTETNFDPFDTAAEVLNLISPTQCEFPPSAEAPARIVQLYLYFVNLTAVVGLMSGGKITGAETVKDLDTLLPQMTAEYGYPPFDPTVVPDLMPDKPDDLPMVGEDTDSDNIPGLDTGGDGGVYVQGFLPTDN